MSCPDTGGSHSRAAWRPQRSAGPGAISARTLDPFIQPSSAARAIAASSAYVRVPRGARKPRKRSMRPSVRAISRWMLTPRIETSTDDCGAQVLGNPASASRPCARSGVIAASAVASVRDAIADVLAERL